MEYMSVKEAAEKWGVTERRVQFYCSHDKIPGVKNIGRQWIIPPDAERPCDGRTKQAKNREIRTPYHFPEYTHSLLYTSRKELSEEERKLYDAQILILEGKLLDSIDKCLELKESDMSPELELGTYWTIAQCYIELGSYEGYNKAFKQIEALCEKEELHKEDYQVLQGILSALISWDMGPLISINKQNISWEAYITYMYAATAIPLVKGEVANDEYMILLSGFCCYLEAKGIQPTLLTVHCILAVSHRRREEEEEAIMHVEAACRIAIEHDWMAFLAKYSNLEIKDIIMKVLAEQGQRYVNAVTKFQKRIMSSWKIMHATESGISKLDNLSNEEVEILVLLAHGYGVKKISERRYYSESQVRKIVRKLCEVYDVKNKTELSVFAQKLLTSEL